MNENSIQVLEIRKTGCTWVFDDASKGVVNEPFVSGVPTIINHILDNKKIVESTVQAFFSQSKFPGADACLTFVKREKKGAWYKFQSMKGWFCPCFWKYFDVGSPPQHLYIQLTSVAS